MTTTNGSVANAINDNVHIYVLSHIPDRPSAKIIQSRLYKAVVLLLLTCCLLLLPLWESVIVLCFVVRYFMSFLVLQSS